MFALSESDKHRLLAAVDAIGRAGARDLEVGYLDDDVPVHLARWHATATFQGAKVSCDEQPGPVEAMEGLLVRLFVGGTCMGCGGRTTVADLAPADAGACTWRRVEALWVAGCVDADAYVAQRHQSRGGAGRTGGWGLDLGW